MIMNNFTNTDNSDNSDNSSDNSDNLSEIFDNIKFDFLWNQESQFGAFENFTTMAMFMWVMVYMTSTAAYQNLIQIILHPQFEKSHLIMICKTSKSIVKDFL
ncbi:hypothetical protein C2G38_2033473 [Gigaspora rosea]|uniref:Uncharacterized protein n=1 Tax=Gigaspora rosea TaxID=44941 RepID=A0A397VL51_9GLOM|nr:hypothetical protein C2G38_2033473 [Gigaspora rosea]